MDMLSNKSVKTKTIKQTANSAAWKAVSRLLRNLDEKETLALFQELYHFSPDNAELIEARFCRTDEDLLQDYLDKIKTEYRLAYREYAEDPKMSWMKSLIRDYKKGTGDLWGTLELMFTFQEEGARFTETLGDIDSRFYDSLISGMNDVIKILTGEGKEFFPAVQARLLKLLQQVYHQYGWGYSDGMEEAIKEIFALYGLEIKCIGERKTGKYKTEYTLEIVGK